MQVERAEEVVKLPAIWRSPLQLLGLLPVIPVLVDLLDPKVEVAVGLLGKGDEASKRGGVAVAGASGALALQTLGAAASMGVQHLVDQLLQKQVADANEEMEWVEEDPDKLHHGEQGHCSVANLHCGKQLTLTLTTSCKHE